ncbi:MAG: orotate phosphoribosyltransferase [Eubacterium sp.]|nr:orotate phosphoribosyltransferase [Eubacterium sp.]
MIKEYTKIPAKMNENVQLKIIPGHFVTTHSHVTNYMEITTLKSRCNEAHGLASLLAMRYTVDTPVDSIICLDGTQVIGTYLAEELTKAGILSYNAHRTIYVIAPELAPTGQIIFRDNMAQLALRKKYVLLLLGSLTTGNSLRSIAASVQYYGAYISGACAIFSAVEDVDGLPVTAAFHPEDVPEYTSYKPNECPLCKQGVPIDAIVNSFGYSELGRKADFYG